MSWIYPIELIDALAGFGLAPTPETAPAVVRDALNDLYRYELRRLRHALVTGAIPKAGYYDRVVDLRRKYPLVSIKPHLWIADDGPRRREDAEMTW